MNAYLRWVSMMRVRWWLLALWVVCLWACEEDKASEDEPTEEPENTMSEPSVERGRRLYEKPPTGQACTVCHGPEGDLDRAANQTVDAQDLTTWDGTEEETRDAITKGRPAMPSYSGFSDEELRDLVLYVHSLREQGDEDHEE